MQNHSLKKTKYKSVNSEERSKIIKYFMDGALSASQISSLTGHNLSTIKAIFRIYKNEGRIKKKDKRDRLTKVEQNAIVFLADDQEKKLELISKQSVMKEIVLKNGEQAGGSYLNIKEFMQNSTDKLMNRLENLESKIKFDQALRQELENGLNEDNFQAPQTNTQAISTIRGHQMKNIFQSYQNNNPQILMTPAQQNQSIQLQELKKVFEQQQKEIYGKLVNLE